jgi:aminopeptidase YwaD
MNQSLNDKAQHYLDTLCNRIPGRAVGSEGNRMATSFFAEELCVCGWETAEQRFEAMDWRGGEASLSARGESFDVAVSPYSAGCDVRGPLRAASTVEQLESLDARGAVVLLHDEIAGEQLMPKNFVFYNPESHQRIIAALEKSGAAALACATSRNAALAGGVYPFPLIEDGDFDIPSVYMTDTEGRRLLGHVGQTAHLRAQARRIPSDGCNVIGVKGPADAPRIVITAHIDAKIGTPGAIDNATGVIALLLTARLLDSYAGPARIELVALNGEDYYAVPGQMTFIERNQDRFGSIALNINIDGGGYREGPSAYSLYGVSQSAANACVEAVAPLFGVIEGEQWPQGDHSIFVQYGIPAIAFSSAWFIEHIDSQTITHTPADAPSIVDCAKVVEIAEAISRIVQALGGANQQALKA